MDGRLQPAVSDLRSIFDHEVVAGTLGRVFIAAFCAFRQAANFWLINGIALERKNRFGQRSNSQTRYVYLAPKTLTVHFTFTQEELQCDEL